MRIQKTESITITTATDASTAGNFSSLTNEVVRKVYIQNTGSNACYVKCGVDSAQTASSTDGIYMASGANVMLDDVRFDYFAIINASAGLNNTVIITGFAL
jgi:hypothetical protein